MKENCNRNTKNYKIKTKIQTITCKKTYKIYKHKLKYQDRKMIFFKKISKKQKNKLRMNCNQIYSSK